MAGLYLTTCKFLLCVGHIKSGQTDGINLKNIMASFWRIQEGKDELILICMGVFIRSNWILVTGSGGEQLNPTNNIVIKSGDEAVQKTLSENMPIDCKKNLHPNSQFQIVYVSTSEIQLYNLDVN